MEYVQLICAMVGILGLIFLLFWALRKFNKGIVSSGGKRLKVLDRAMLGNDRYVVVVSVAGKCMVLGVSSSRIEKISDLEISEEDYLEQLYPENREGAYAGKGGFFAAFTDALAQNVKGMRKNGQGEAPFSGFDARTQDKEKENREVNGTDD